MSASDKREELAKDKWTCHREKNKLENNLSPSVQVCWQKFPYHLHTVPGTEKNVYTDTLKLKKKNIKE